MKIRMEDLFVVGCLFSGYAFFQLLGIIIRGFPDSRNGAIALAMLGLFVILCVGFINWCGLWYKRGGTVSKNQSVVGFAPFYVLGAFALAALAIGFNAGG